MEDKITEQQREAWNKFSPGWKKWDDHVIGWLKPVGDKILEMADLESDDIVLDAATGTGEPGLTAAMKVKKVIGTDLAEEMVKIALEKAADKGITNYEARTADALKLPFEDNYFDAVICRFGVIFFPDPVSGLKEFRRVLKPGGRISVSAWAEPHKNKFAVTIQGIVNEMLNLPAPPPDSPGLFRCSNPGTLLNMFKECGLHNVNEAEVTGEVIFDSGEHYWNFMTEVAAPITMPLSKTNNEMQQKVRQKVLDTVKPMHRDRKLPLTWSAWVACGIK